VLWVEGNVVTGDSTRSGAVKDQANQMKKKLEDIANSLPNLKFKNFFTELLAKKNGSVNLRNLDVAKFLREKKGSTIKTFLFLYQWR
jgi:hypothetical protein